MKNMGGLLKQAQQMQAKLSTLQNELATREFSATSGGGMVEVVVNGKQELTKVSIKPDCVNPEDVEMLEELVMVATNEAVKKSQDTVSQAMSKVTGGVNIPGLFGS